MSETIVCFHAHPDDEALLTAGTMAKAAAAGHRVVTVFATRGDAGKAHRTLHAGLGARREAEARHAAEILGCARVEFLGFADSGSDGEHPDGFAYVDVDTAADRLVAILESEQPSVLISYDARGGYGHPDHVQVHRVGARAAQRLAIPYPYEATVDRALFSLGVDTAASLGLELPEGVTATRFAHAYSASDEITTVVNVAAFLDQKRAALVAHQSQATSDDGVDRTIALLASLPEELFALGFANEWFIARFAGDHDPLAELE